jgi:tetratricopeptide (TPR) repeat protein
MRRIVVGLCLLCWFVGRADAQEVPGAVDYLKEGLALFQAGDYAKAAEKFEKAHALDPGPAATFAWAQALRKNGECPRAIELYKRFLQMEISEEQRQAALESMELCPKSKVPPPIEEPGAGEAGPPDAGEEKQSDAEEAVADPAHGGLHKTAPLTLRPWYRSKWVLLSASAGAGALIAGGVTYWQGRSAQHDLKSAGSYGEHDRLLRRVESRKTTAALLGGVGAGLLLVGAVVYWQAGSVESGSPSLSVTSTGATIGYCLAF